MKVLVTRTQINMEEAIPDLEREFPDVEFVYCADRSQAAELIEDADVYFGGMNRDLFLAAKKAQVDPIVEHGDQSLSGHSRTG